MAICLQERKLKLNSHLEGKRKACEDEVSPGNRSGSHMVNSRKSYQAWQESLLFMSGAVQGRSPHRALTSCKLSLIPPQKSWEFEPMSQRVLNSHDILVTLKEMKKALLFQQSLCPFSSNIPACNPVKPAAEGRGKARRMK